MFSVAIELGALGALDHYRPLPIAEDLRGYAEERSQVRAAILSGPVVSITGLSAGLCPTRRDLYLDKKLKLDTPTWERHVLGKVVDSALLALHRIGLDRMEDAFERSIKDRKPIRLAALGRQITSAAEEAVRGLVAELTVKGESIEAFAASIAPNNADALVENTTKALVDLVRYETRLLIAFLRRRRRGVLGWRLLWRSSSWMAEARAALTRLQMDIQLERNENEARSFGLSSGIRPDFLYAVTLVGDIKTGQYHQYQESVATGYAIFAEFKLKRRINTAFILAIDLDIEAGRLASHRVIAVHPDNDHRRTWITQRDLALNIIRAAAPPPHPKELGPCQVCPYRSHCWQEGKVGTIPLIPGPSTPAVPQEGTA